MFEKATINLENGKSFTVEANNISEEHKYIKSVKLNGNDYKYSYINHQDIMTGGSLVFEMTNQPTNWGTKDKFIPSTKIDDHLIVAAPFIAKGKTAFKGSTEITLENVDSEATIYYRLGYKGGFKKYEQPFVIDKFINLDVYAQKGNTKSTTISTDFYKINPNIKIDLKTEYANQYNAGGDNALIDGIVGAEDFRTGTWQGYFDTDVIAIVDLGSQKNINEVSIGFLQDQKSWIFLPTQVEFLFSKNGVNYTSVYKGNFGKILPVDKPNIKESKTGQFNLQVISVDVSEGDGMSWLCICVPCLYLHEFPDV